MANSIQFALLNWNGPDYTMLHIFEKLVFSFNFYCLTSWIQKSHYFFLPSRRVRTNILKLHLYLMTNCSVFLQTRNENLLKKLLFVIIWIMMNFAQSWCKLCMEVRCLGKRYCCIRLQNFTNISNWVLNKSHPACFSDCQWLSVFLL